MNINRHGDELDRLLYVQGPVERAGLAEALRSLRDRVHEEPSPAVAERHLAAITAAAADAAHAAPTTPARADTSPWRARGRRVLGLTALKVAIGVTAAAAATGSGMAATGNLPDPVQRAVAEVADRVGIQLPFPADSTPAAPRDEAPSTIPPDDAGRPDEPRDGHQPTPARPDGSAPSSEVPGRGEPPTDPSEHHQHGDAGEEDQDEAPIRRPTEPGPDAADEAPDEADEGTVPGPTDTRDSDQAPDRGDAAGTDPEDDASEPVEPPAGPDATTRIVPAPVVRTGPTPDPAAP